MDQPHECQEEIRVLVPKGRGSEKREGLSSLESVTDSFLSSYRVSQYHFPAHGLY